MPPTLRLPWRRRSPPLPVDSARVPDTSMLPSTSKVWVIASIDSVEPASTVRFPAICRATVGDPFDRSRTVLFETRTVTG